MNKRIKPTRSGRVTGSPKGGKQKFSGPFYKHNLMRCSSNMLQDTLCPMAKEQVNDGNKYLSYLAWWNFCHVTCWKIPWHVFFPTPATLEAFPTERLRCGSYSNISCLRSLHAPTSPPPSPGVLSPPSCAVEEASRSHKCCTIFLFTSSQK